MKDENKPNKVTPRRTMRTAEDCAKGIKNIVGEKVLVYPNVHTSDVPREGWIVGMSSRYNTSYYIAFDTPEGVAFEDVHDQYVRDMNGNQKSILW
jgi:hypothetical protein